MSGGRAPSRVRHSMDPFAVPAEEPGRSILLSVPSRMEMLAVVDGLVQALLIQLEVDEETSIAVATAVVEAGTNAIQHGHRQDERLLVQFRFYLGDAAFEVWVRDVGPGFDLETVMQADPTRPEDILKARGRGIFIMRSMMDTVDFDIRPGKGTTVHLIKRIRNGDGAPASE